MCRRLIRRLRLCVYYRLQLVAMWKRKFDWLNAPCSPVHFICGTSLTPSKLESSNMWARYVINVAKQNMLNTFCHIYSSYEGGYSKLSHLRLNTAETKVCWHLTSTDCCTFCGFPAVVFTCNFLISFLRSASYFSFWLALAALWSCREERTQWVWQSGGGQMGRVSSREPFCSFKNRPVKLAGGLLLTPVTFV